MSKLAGFVGGNSGIVERSKDDFYATPAHAVKAILEREVLSGRILEPACGDGAISKMLPGEVVSIDIVDRGYGEVENYFFHQPTAPYDVVITNPPYKDALPFIKKALQDVKTGGKVIMLLKLTFLEGQERYAFFQQCPPRRVWVFSQRLNFQSENKSGLLAFGWYVWEKGYTAKTEIGWIPKGK